MVYIGMTKPRKEENKKPATPVVAVETETPKPTTTRKKKAKTE